MAAISMKRFDSILVRLKVKTPCLLPTAHPTFRFHTDPIKNISRQPSNILYTILRQHVNEISYFSTPADKLFHTSINPLKDQAALIGAVFNSSVF